MITEASITAEGNVTVHTSESIRWTMPYGNGSTIIESLHNKMELHSDNVSARLSQLSLLNPEIATLTAVLAWSYGNYVQNRFISLTVTYRAEENTITLDNDSSCIVLTFNKKFLTLTAEHFTELTTRKKVGSIIEMDQILVDCAVSKLDREYFQTLFNRGVFTIA